MCFACRSQPPDRIIHKSTISSKFFKLTTAAPLSGQLATDGPNPAYQLLTEAEVEAVSFDFPREGISVANYEGVSAFL